MQMTNQLIQAIYYDLQLTAEIHNFIVHFKNRIIYYFFEIRYINIIIIFSTMAGIAKTSYIFIFILIDNICFQFLFSKTKTNEKRFLWTNNLKK